ncbi:MAG TPA: alpha/beta hydrolase [Nevskiaceae bacterium]|nr:alpha/beta hydrolase [Nevskiaceae bacterium]
MDITVNGNRLYAYVGDHPFDAAKPTIIFVHGVLNDHSVWGLQSRHFAYNGFNALAIDLPGHGRSDGAPPESVESAADTILALLDALKVRRAALVGHSWGSLITLEAAGRAPQRVTHLALLGTAFPMKVSPALLDASLHAPEKAIHMVNTFSHSTLCPPPSMLGPGTWVYGTSRALMRRTLRNSPRPDLFYTDFLACDRYAGGEKAMAAVTCPTLFVIGKSDQMAAPRSARALANLAAHGRSVEVEAGHAMMAEAPEVVLNALRGFLMRPQTAPAAA